MESVKYCCLCTFSCNLYKSLYFDNGEESTVYQVAIKYFNSSLLNAESDITLRVICSECWQHISDFHSFQDWVLNAQTQELDFKFTIHDKQILSSDITDPSIDSTIENLNGSTATKYNPKFEGVESGYVKRVHEMPQNRKDQNLFKCETCGASFSQYGNLRRHARKKHAIQPLIKWICRYCKKMFKNRKNLEQHKNQIHNCEREFEKNMADQYLDNEENCEMVSEYETDKICKESRISNHYTAQHDQKIFKQICNKDVDSSSTKASSNNFQIQMPSIDIIDIKNEISTDESDEDTDKRTYKTYSGNVNSEEVHEDSSTELKDLMKCPTCYQPIKNFPQLSEHFILEHPEERCYIVCCHLTLYDQKSFEEHLQFHKNSSTFECTDCGKCFNNKKGLTSHRIQVHTKKRSVYHMHLCYCKRAEELCDKNKTNEKQTEYDTFVCCHRKKKILEDDAVIAKWKKELSCEICKATFSYFSLMRSHFYYEHPGEKCYILCCQRKMSRASDAVEHIRFHLDPHAYRCKVCKLDFSAKNTLGKHMRNNHLDSLPKNKWACNECDKTFQIRQVLTRHKNVFHSKQV